MCTSPLYRIGRFALELGGGNLPPALFSALKSKGQCIIGWREYLDWRDRYLIPDYMFQMLPCGKCTECRIKKSKEWATRCVAEKMTSDGDCWFVTLTYNDTKLHFAECFDRQFAVLDKRDPQLFFKRLRKALYGSKKGNLRYFLSGEYGDRTFRPHYHAIIYNLSIPDLQIYKIVKKTVYYKSDWLQQIWKNGYVVIGKVNNKTCAYTASYTLKKVGFAVSPQSALDRLLQIKDQAITPEYMRCLCASGLIQRPFALMSRRKAIGREYFDQHPQSVENGLPEFPISKISYFDNLVKKLDPFAFEDLKDYRGSIAEAARKQTEACLICPEEVRFMLREEYRDKCRPRNKI